MKRIFDTSATATATSIANPRKSKRTRTHADAKDTTAKPLSNPYKTKRTTVLAVSTGDKSSVFSLEKEKQPPEKILAQRVNGKVKYMTPKTSWYILARNWKKTPNEHLFNEEWNKHPEKRHQLKLFGRQVSEKRWSQAWGRNYAYSGSVNSAKEPDEMIQSLIDTANELTCDIFRSSRDDNEFSSSYKYNAVLQNWYTPDDTIGLHADDEKDLILGLPIFSLSWGGTRRFVLRSKCPNDKTIDEIYINDGDLVIMGGTLQQTHKHEVPKVRKTKDPLTSNRINYTIRAFRE